MKTPTIHATHYGRREVAAGGHEAGEGGHVWRIDRYTPNDGNRATMERTHAASRTDVSPVVSTYAAQIGETGPHVRAYSSRCSGCYLGHSHTTDVHDRAIAK